MCEMLVLEHNQRLNYDEGCAAAVAADNEIFQDEDEAHGQRSRERLRFTS